MYTHALPSTPALPGPVFTASWLAGAAERMSAVLARWVVERRERLAYRRDLIALAGLGDRELADFGAPDSLFADVHRYRQAGFWQGVL